MSDDPAQCPECNRWSDRNDYVKYAGTNHRDEPVYACLHPSCAAYAFKKGSDSAFGLLNMEGIRKSGKRVMEVKKDKLDHYEELDF